MVSKDKNIRKRPYAVHRNVLHKVLYSYLKLWETAFFGRLEEI